MNSMYVSKLNNKTELRKEKAEDTYKNPMPLDMINKFVGLDSRTLHHDVVVQKQAFDQSYKNFWSFVDFNIKYGEDNPIQDNTCTHSLSFHNVKPDSSVTKADRCLGIHMTYEEARQKANQLLEKKE